MLKTHLFGALEKFIPGADVEAYPEISGDVAARGECCAFQFALRSDDRPGWVCVDIDGQDLAAVVRTVELSPSDYPGPRIGGDVLSEEPGLFADLLKPLENERFARMPLGQWRIFYVSVKVPRDAKPGVRSIRVTIAGRPLKYDRWQSMPLDGTVTLNYALEVLPFELPEQKILRLEWLHTDCLASCYGERAWSERHWRIVENFAANAAAHGVNVLFTPLWTPPLDTGIGLERPDCQLLEIGFDPENGKYTFDFSRLERYLLMGERLGFRAFSMSHLFTQWGAKFTPAIRVRFPDGEIRRRFGWDIAADSPEYRSFLEQLFPALLPLLRRCGKQCFFSLSDEPYIGDIEHYRSLVEFVRPLLEEFDTVEAMSNVEYYQAGLIRHPVAALNHMEAFRGVVKELCGYYCVSQADCTNRFFKMPLRRTRIFGVLAYVYGLKLFLHWGFNFYYAQYSTGTVDPFRTTDAGGAFPSGDPFLVYPAPDGNAWDSLRHEAFSAGLQDLRALEALECRIGRQAVLSQICDAAGGEPTMTAFPANDAFLLNLRKSVYEQLRR